MTLAFHGDNRETHCNSHGGIGEMAPTAARGGGTSERTHAQNARRGRGDGEGAPIEGAGLSHLAARKGFVAREMRCARQAAGQACYSG